MRAGGHREWVQRRNPTVVENGDEADKRSPAGWVQGGTGAEEVGFDTRGSGGTHFCQAHRVLRSRSGGVPLSQPPSLITDCAVDFGTAQAGWRVTANASHLQPAQKQRRRVRRSICLALQHTGQGAEFRARGHSVPPARAPGLVLPLGPRAAAPQRRSRPFFSPRSRPLCGAGVLGAWVSGLCHLSASTRFPV